MTNISDFRQGITERTANLKGGARDVHLPGGPNSSFSCSFQQKIEKLALLGVGAPLGKILDPPL